MAEKLKVGVVGVGGIARSHLPGWQASEHAELAAGSDISEEVLKGWGEQNGVQRLYTDPEDLFQDPEIDIVDVCTPNNYHAPLSIGALEAGKHVICEKPLAPKPELVEDERFEGVPKILETPKDDDPVAADLSNLHLLRSFRA